MHWLELSPVDLPMMVQEMYVVCGFELGADVGTGWCQFLKPVQVLFFVKAKDDQD